MIRFARSLGGLKTPSPVSGRSTGRLGAAVVASIVFLLAFGVRQLHYQDYHLKVGSDLGSLVARYQRQAGKMLAGEGLLFPERRGNIQMLVHPPGYSILIAALFGLFGQSNELLVQANILICSITAVLVFLLALELLPLKTSAIAGLLVAFSPHLSHHSLMLLPDPLVAAPTLIAIYLIAKAAANARLFLIVGAAVMVGVSCWLRSNALLLPLMLALAVYLLFDRGRRTRYAIAFIVTAVLMIAPITIRNWIVFDAFIPLSLGSGITLIEGIGDYDRENRFGMPATDAEAKWKDVEWHGRQDYAEGLWKPDGIARERYRFARGLDVILDHPGWFAGVMTRRAASMLRYNDTIRQGWPEDTARTPVVSAEPSFGRRAEPLEGEPVWSKDPSALLAEGETPYSQTECSIDAERNRLIVAGDTSEFGDQWLSPPITVEKNADYKLRIRFKLISGLMAVKLTSADRRITLASQLIHDSRSKRVKRKAENDDKNEQDIQQSVESNKETRAEDLEIAMLAFATSNRNEVRLVISNDGASSARPIVEVAKAELFAVGPTPYLWTRFIRRAVRGIQRNLYTTSRLVPLIAMGIILLAYTRRKRALIILLAVPAYYLLAQSVFHTEYRYILPIHYFLFVFAGVSIYIVIDFLGACARQGFRLITERRA